MNRQQKYLSLAVFVLALCRLTGDEGGLVLPALPRPSSSPDERDEELLRRARLLRGRHAPEWSTGFAAFNNEVDEIRSAGTAISLPCGDHHRPGVELWRSRFRDAIGNDEDLTRASVRWLWRPEPGRLRWVQAGAARGVATHPTASAGVVQPWAKGGRLQLRGAFGQPWDASAATVREDGQVASFGGGLAIPVEHFTLVTEAGLGWYTLAAATPGGASAGRTQEGVLRVEWSPVRRPSRNESWAFRDAHELFEDVPQQDVAVYVSARRHRHLDPSPHIPVLESSTDLRLGLAAGQDLGARLHIGIEAHVGADPARDLAVGEIHGLRGRLQAVIDERRRVSLSVGREAEGGTTVPVGATTSLSLDFSWRF